MTDANVVFVARAGVLTCGFDELMRDIEQAVEAVRGRLAGRKPVVPAKK
jgi:RNase P protein component